MTESRHAFPRGIWVPLITPFAGDDVDHESLARLVKQLRGSGLAGFVACGSTGEAASLSDTEQRAVVRTVLDAAGGLPVMMGLGGSSTATVREQLLQWAELPLAGFLISAPSYIRPSQAGIADYFRALADASPLPIVLYDVPSRTGVRIETATMLTLAGHPRIVGVKDCSADLDHLQALLSDGRLAVLCGDDARMFASLCLGGAGAIAASAHLRPELFVRLQRLVDSGDLPAARALWHALWPLTQAVFTDPNPAPVKAALAAPLSLSDALRAPMTAASNATREQLARALAALPA